MRITNLGQLARGRGAAALLVVVVVGCASSGAGVRVDKDATADLSKCRTFSWHSTPGAGASSLNEQRVREAAMQTLKAKGYAEGAENADCRVSYALTARELPKSGPSVGVGAGGGSGGVGGGIGISLPIGKKHKFAGTVTIDVIDSARNAQIWTGSLEQTLSGKDLSPDEAQAAVKKILSKYPDSTAK